jgi:hypothetical protein
VSFHDSLFLKKQVSKNVYHSIPKHPAQLIISLPFLLYPSHPASSSKQSAVSTAMDNHFVTALLAAGVLILQINRLIISLAAAGIAVTYLGTLWSTLEPYYGDGGQARYTRFLLNNVRPSLFREITQMERTTFNLLVEEFRMNDLLKDGRSVSVEEQVLIFLDIVCHSNAMRQTAVKFCRGLYTVQR